MTDSPTHVRLDDVPWGDYSAWYPADQMQSMRAKRLIGPGGVIPDDDTLFGLLEIDPGGGYPAHRHAAPEVYFVLSGRAECRFGAEVFEASAGSVIRTAPNQTHSFTVLGDEPFRAVAYWYAPGGDLSVLSCDLELVDESDGSP